MKIVRDITSIYQSLPFPVVTVGNFDGIHLGHQHVVRETSARARREKGTAVVITFTPHTKRVIYKDNPPLLMTTDEQKVEFIDELGADILVFLSFDEKLAKTPARDFILNYLLSGIGMKAIYLSCYFGLGQGRGGGVFLLRELSKEYDFDVVVVDEVIVNGEIVSSSDIRKRIAEGRVDEAARFLGRPYFIDGEVVPGEKRGIRLSFPTANLKTGDVLLPADGVYLTFTTYKGKRLISLTNIGAPATFGVSERRIEVHLIDFKGGLYGEKIRVHFLDRLREVKKFASEDKLRKQIEDDVSRAKDYISLFGFSNKLLKSP
jgi:riboflavin kinase/FMN adenylyltransferase